MPIKALQQHPEDKYVTSYNTLKYNVLESKTRTAPLQSIVLRPQATPMSQYFYQLDF
jgi:hypothetical protein